MEYYNNYMKEFDENKELSYLKYWDINNLYGWAIVTKVALMTLNGLKIFLNLMKALKKSYNEETDEGYFLEVNVQYPEKLHDLHNELPFLPERMKIEKIKKLIGKLGKTEYVIHIKFSKINMKSWISFEKSSYSRQVLLKGLVKTIY